MKVCPLIMFPSFPCQPPNLQCPFNEKMKLKVCLHVHGKTSMKVQFIDTLADDPDVLIELNPYALV